MSVNLNFASDNTICQVKALYVAFLQAEIYVPAAGVRAELTISVVVLL